MPLRRANSLGVVGPQNWMAEYRPYSDALRPEAGPGASRTDIYAYEIAPEALESPPDPAFLADVAVSGSGVIVRVVGVGLGLAFEEGSSVRRLLHPHVYIDRDPPADGDVIPLDDPSIVHSIAGSIRVRDLAPGEHTLWVVGADGNDRAVVPPGPVRLDITIEP
jgi:hypothetical protein